MFIFIFRFYWLLYLVLFVLLPINTPLEYFNDSVQAAIFVAFSLRYFIVLNVCWLINSAHFIWGLDKNHKQSDSNMVFIVTKSYWPQYHYLLNWDYQSGEFGNYGKGMAIKSSSLKIISYKKIEFNLNSRMQHGNNSSICGSWVGHQSANHHNRSC